MRLHVISYWLHQCLYRACNPNKNACVSQAFPYLVFLISSSGPCSCPSSMRESFRGLFSTTSLFTFCRSFPRINSDSGMLKEMPGNQNQAKGLCKNKEGHQEHGYLHGSRLAVPDQWRPSLDADGLRGLWGLLPSTVWLITALVVRQVL